MNIKQQRAAALKAAQDILDGAKAAGRALTTGEDAQIAGHVSRVKELDEQIAAAAKSDALMARIAGLGSGNYTDDLDGETAPGELFTEDQKAGLVRAIRSKGSFGTNVRFKAPITGIGIGLPSAGVTTVEAAVPAGMVALRNLFQQAQAESATVRYYRVGTGTAAVVAEGALKPDAGITTVPVDEDLIKIAATFQVGDELGEDAPYLVASIQRQAIMGVLAKENAEIIAAIGGASGILTATGTKAAALDLLATEIGDQQAINGLIPNALVMNPADLAAIRIAKASTGGSYFIDPLSAGPTSIHGVPVLSTGATAPGTAYLLSEGFGVFFTRGQGLRVELGYSGDDWSRNLATTRVEERVLPAITTPAMITKITLT